MMEIEKNRKKIDEIDNRIIELLADRIKIVDSIAEYKKENKIPFYDEKRFRELIENRTETGRKHGLEEDFVESVFKLIHEFSLKHQKDSIVN